MVFYFQVRSLQYLCRFVIRQYTRVDHIQSLPLPTRIKGYLEEGHYWSRQQGMVYDRAIVPHYIMQKLDCWKLPL